MINSTKRSITVLITVFLLVLQCSIPQAAFSVFAQSAEEEEIHGMGYIDNEFTVDAPDEYYSEDGLLFAAPLPDAYDLRDYGRVTSVKDQGQFGSCWTFSAIACVESNLITRGYADMSIDLSEKHLAYYTYNHAADKLGNTDGDYTYSPGSHYLDAGGNSWQAGNTLANWEGLVLESEMPYDTAATFDPSRTYPEKNAYSLDQYHIDNVYWVSTQSTDYIKEQIMRIGAGEVGVYYSDTYMQYDNNAYCCAGISSTNHSVTIVGWDDNYPRENFKAGYTPYNDGAWLVKNSWGPNWSRGDEGYFWMSYEDSSFCDPDNEVTFFEASPVGRDYNIYQYDGSSGRWSKSNTNGMIAANVYKVAADDEMLTEVCFYTMQSNVRYSIQVYTNVNKLPNSGNAAFSVPQTGKVGPVGYYTIPLSKPVPLTKGEKFSIVLELECEDGTKAKYMFDRDYATNSLTYKASAQPGQSFYSTNNGKTWYDITETTHNTAAFRIKGITYQTAKVTRLAGDSRTQTAVEISRAAYDRADNVILASGDSFADALAGVPLAHALEAPILLVRNHKLDDATIGELRRLEAKTVYILGGTGVVNDRVAASLENMGCTVDRIAGDDRFGTAVEIATRLRDIKGATPEVFFAYSHNYPDALAISGVAAAKGCPILYITGDGTLNWDEMVFMYISGVEQATILGGAAVISEDAEVNILDAGVSVVDRIAGTNRYDTCIKINREYAEYLTGDAVCVATGNDYPDALAGGVFAAIYKAPLVLTGSSLSVDQQDYLRSRDVANIYVMGGKAVVPNAVADQIRICS